MSGFYRGAKFNQCVLGKNKIQNTISNLKKVHVSIRFCAEIIFDGNFISC